MSSSSPALARATPTATADLRVDVRFSDRPGSSSPALSNPAIASPTFTADSAGLYALSLVVFDGTFHSPRTSSRWTSGRIGGLIGNYYSTFQLGCRSAGHPASPPAFILSNFSIVTLPPVNYRLHRHRQCHRIGRWGPHRSPGRVYPRPQLERCLAAADRRHVHANPGACGCHGAVSFFNPAPLGPPNPPAQAASVTGALSFFNPMPLGPRIRRRRPRAPPRR